NPIGFIGHDLSGSERQTPALGPGRNGGTRRVFTTTRRSKVRDGENGDPNYHGRAISFGHFRECKMAFSPPAPALLYHGRRFRMSYEGWWNASGDTSFRSPA